MRTETITKEIFTFDELGDSAKENAREWYRQCNLDYEWWDSVYDDFDQICEILGVSVREKYFTGFWSQGDGACFFGSYSYAKGCAKRIREYAPNDKELHRIADELVKLQSHHFYQLNATISRYYGAGSYEHSGTMSVDTSHNWHNELDDSVIEDMRDLLRDLADWFYRQLEREYEYLQSDEVVDENIEANGYEFTEEGNIA